MSKYLVNIDNLSIGYHNQRGHLIHVLKNVSLRIKPGETLGLVGESGCGKSTLGQAMMGYLRSGSRLLDGKVRFNSQDIFKLKRRELEYIRGRKIALIPQNAGESLTPTMRVGKQIVEAIKLNTEFTGKDAFNRMIELLGQVRLPHPDVMAERYPHELSGGQQQRVAVAMALAGEPDMLVLDEPTTGLDVTTQAHILDLMKDLVSEIGTAMMYISHDLGVIARVSDWVTIMYAGEIVEDTSVEGIFSNPSHPYTRGLLQSIPRLSLAGIPRSMDGRPPIPGTLPGCSFAPRCPYSTDICESNMPELVSMEDKRHSVRCHHWEKVSETDFSMELKEVFHTIKHNIIDESVIDMSEVDITYHRPTLTDRIRKAVSPPDTVSDITFSVKRGETLALVGESGSGKSTIVRTISGLMPAKDGKIKFGDFNLTIDIDGRPLELCKNIQLIFQNPDASLNPRHTVAEILDQPLKLYFPKLNRDERRARQIEILNRVRIGQKSRLRYPGQLSGGEKQRVSIARAFIANPEVVLCDEVTSSLDVSVQAAVLDLLADLQKEHDTTYIFITHDLAVVRAFADRVAVLYQGRLCEIGSVDDIYSPPYHPYTETLLGAVLEPDPNSEPKLLAKDLPELAPPAVGCAFQRRCPNMVENKCNVESPPWQYLDEKTGHKVCCFTPVDELKARQVSMV